MSGIHSTGGRGLPPAMPPARAGGGGGGGGGGTMQQQRSGSPGGAASTMSAPPSQVAAEGGGMAEMALRQLRQHAGQFYLFGIRGGGREAKSKAAVCWGARRQGRSLAHSPPKNILLPAQTHQTKQTACARRRRDSTRRSRSW